jgi:hypothetical protein
MMIARRFSGNPFPGLLAGLVALTHAVLSPAYAAEIAWSLPAFWQTAPPPPNAEARRIVSELNLKPPAVALAARVTSEGHWTFTNKAGQQFTAANPHEMSRVTTMLAPGRSTASPALTLYIPAPSVITHAQHLPLLPPKARLRIVTGDTSYRLMALATDPGKQTWFAEVSPNVFVRADRVDVFDQTVWQLRRPVSPRHIRILSLEPGGPDALPPRPPQRNEGEEPVIEPVNPPRLAEAIRALTGQMIVVTGRLEGDETLVYRTPTGAERTLHLAPLRAAASRADADLIMLTAAAPRQPGARNWLWLRVDVDNLFEALDRATLGRFLNALAGDQGRLFVTVARATDRRLALSIVPLAGRTTDTEPGTIAGLLAEIASEVAGTVVPHAVEVDLVARPRAQELAHRLLPGIPAFVQHLYLGALLMALVAFPVSRAWWRRIWPDERPADYADRTGFWAAYSIRWTLFALLFLPLAGPSALLWALLTGAWRRPRKPAGAGT